MIETIHDFVAKLRGPTIHGRVVDAIAAGQDRGERDGSSLADAFASRLRDVGGPFSINLDVTTACNYRCPHCIDADILNTGDRFSFSELLRSLVILRLAGLRSVILIGGGEPTVHKQFRRIVHAIKALGLECGIVTNGGSTQRIAEVLSFLGPRDWVRFSLDAATDKTFHLTHLPGRKSTTLQSICAAVPGMKASNPDVTFGFSYVIMHDGCTVGGRKLHSNVHEIAAAAALAKRFRFDYLSLKPLLDRDPGGAETIAGKTSHERKAILAEIASQIALALALQDEKFRVFPSVNLAAMLEEKNVDYLRNQPGRCHMRLFRQVVTPIGVYGCPVYRANAKDQIGAASGYASVAGLLRMRRRVFELREKFNATHECRNVSCLYNSANWWLETLDTNVPPLAPTDELRSDSFF
jgi:hypothetical protein